MHIHTYTYYIYIYTYIGSCQNPATVGKIIITILVKALKLSFMESTGFPVFLAGPILNIYIYLFFTHIDSNDLNLYILTTKFMRLPLMHSAGDAADP